MDQDKDDAPRETPAGWLDALARARADVAAGRTVPLEDVVADLQAGLDRAVTQQASKVPRALKA